ncbi:Cytidylate kinase [Nymphon striatum]|nr:Cytidylate kinase [Nymphon striatum]
MNNDDLNQTPTNEIPVVTIDGPAGSGKGTIAQAIAEKLAWKILDSGALYRLVALAAQRKGVELNIEDSVHADGSLSVEDSLADIAQTLDVVFAPCKGGGVEIQLEGDDVTHAIRTEECGCAASQVATKKRVRGALLDRQRNFQESPGPEIRAQRRQNQLKEQGIDASLGGLIHDIEERDARDMHRKDAPLIPADDAMIIDTGTLSIDEVVSLVMNKVQAVY